MARLRAIFYCFQNSPRYPWRIRFSAGDRDEYCGTWPGAVGSLWALHLHSAGHQVALWSRQAQPTITLQLDEEAPISFRNQNLDTLIHADLLLITVKAWQVEAALQPLLPI